MISAIRHEVSRSLKAGPGSVQIVHSRRSPTGWEERNLSSLTAANLPSDIACRVLIARRPVAFTAAGDSPCTNEVQSSLRKKNVMERLGPRDSALLGQELTDGSQSHGSQRTALE